MLSDQELLRYSRQVLLAQIDIDGQLRLKQSKALIVGLGGLGSPVALYLAAAGVGELHLADFDTVDLTNLQRQIVHTTERVGMSKVQSAQQGLAAINPDVQLHALAFAADEALLSEWVPQAQVVLDCTDRFATRQMINRACHAAGVPLVSASALGFDGQVTVLGGSPGQAPCYACLFPPDEPPPEERCATLGVFAPLVGIVGTLQAAEALKLLTGLGSRLTGRLLMLDGRDMAFNEISLPQNPHCPVCGHPHA